MCPIAPFCLVDDLCPNNSGSVYFCVLELLNVGVSTEY